MTTSEESVRRRRLEKRLRELRESVRQELIEAGMENFADLVGSAHDIGDESTADLLADVSLSAIERHAEEIRVTEQALRRMQAGTYGRCVDCAEAIDGARLDAHPAAARCHACQSKRERLQPHPPSI